MTATVAINELSTTVKEGWLFFFFFFLLFLIFCVKNIFKCEKKRKSPYYSYFFQNQKWIKWMIIKEIVME